MVFIWSRKAFFLPLFLINFFGLVLLLAIDPNCWRLGDIHDWDENAICKIGLEGDGTQDATKEHIARMKKKRSAQPKCLKKIKEGMLDTEKILKTEGDEQKGENGICGVSEEKKNELMAKFKLTPQSGTESERLKEYYVEGCFVCPIPAIKLKIESVEVVGIFVYYKTIKAEYTIEEYIPSWRYIHLDNSNFACIGRMKRTKSIELYIRVVYLKVKHNCNLYNYDIIEYIYLDKFYEANLSNVLIYPAKRVTLCFEEDAKFCSAYQKKVPRHLAFLYENWKKARHFTKFPNVDPAYDVVQADEKKKEEKEQKEKPDKS